MKYDLILPGDRELAIKCKDFAERNMRTLCNLVHYRNNFSVTGIIDLVQVCHMCGFIKAAHWDDTDDCPSPDGSNFSDSTFLADPELTQFSRSLFELLGGKI